MTSSLPSPTVNLGPVGSSADRSASLISKLARELHEAWSRGESLCVEELLARSPELRDNPEAVLRLIYEEICLRQERGESSLYCLLGVSISPGTLARAAVRPSWG